MDVDGLEEGLSDLHGHAEPYLVFSRGKMEDFNCFDCFTFCFGGMTEKGTEGSVVSKGDIFKELSCTRVPTLLREKIILICLETVTFGIFQENSKNLDDA